MRVKEAQEGVLLTPDLGFVVSQLSKGKSSMFKPPDCAFVMAASANKCNSYLTFSKSGHRALQG